MTMTSRRWAGAAGVVLGLAGLIWMWRRGAPADRPPESHARSTRTPPSFLPPDVHPSNNQTVAQNPAPAGRAPSPNPGAAGVGGSRPAPRHPLAVQPGLFEREASEALAAAIPEPDRAHLLRLKSRFVLPGPLVVPPFAGARGHLFLSFTDIPNEGQRRKLEKFGVLLEHYLPDYAWLARLDRDTYAEVMSLDFVRGAEAILPEDKLAETLYRSSPGAWSELPDGRLHLLVQFLPSVPFKEARIALAGLGLAPEQTGYLFNSKCTVAVRDAAVLDLVSLDSVHHVAEAPPPPKACNAAAATLVKASSLYPSPYGLNGSGVRVGIWDGGVAQSSHPALTGRVSVMESASIDSHGTHVTGTIGGSGSGNSSAKGMAPACSLYSYEWNNPFNEMATAKSSYSVILANHSWGVDAGSGYFGTYSAYTDDWDVSIRSTNMLVFKAAGNDQSYGPYDTIDTDSTAKNLTAVGGLTDSGGMTNFSGWGPCDDGRVKPDLCANGSGLTSTYPTSSYASMSGTSMASPSACGAAALFVQRWRQLNSNANPLPAMARACLLHTCQDLGHAGPDYQYGFGLMNVKAAVDLINADASASVQNLVSGSVANGAVLTYSVSVPTGAAEVKFTLVWTDPAGSPSAALARVNDLDLEATSPTGAAVSPFVLNKASPTSNATTGHNDVDTVEQIRVASPAAGPWTVRVRGHVVPQGPQAFALITTPSLQLAAPTTPVLSVNPSSLSFTAAAGGANPAAQSVSISNGGGGTLTWTVSTNAAWLTAAPASGSGNGSVSVSANISGMAAGNYSANLTVSATGAAQSPTTIPVTLSVTGSLYTKDESPDLPIPDANTTGITSLLSEPDSKIISDLNVYVNITHTYIGDCKISITSPAGTTVVLQNPSNATGSLATWYDTQTAPAQALSAFNGQNAQGTWRLTVQDLYAQDVGTLNLWKIEVLAAPPNSPILAVSPTSLSFTGTVGGTNPAAKAVTISNAGSGTLTWSVSDNATWLSASPVSGTGNATTSASVNLSGLAAGTYSATLTVSATGASGSPVNIPVTLTLGGTIYTKDQSPDLPIPDANSTGVTSLLSVPDSKTIAEVNVYVNITHTYRGDLKISVISPAGTTVVLQNTSNATGGLATWYDTQTAPAQSLTAFNGQNSLGTWRLKVQDLYAQDVGTLNLWRLEITAAPQATAHGVVDGEGSGPAPFDSPSLREGTLRAGGGDQSGHIPANSPRPLSSLNPPALSEVRGADRVEAPPAVAGLTLSRRFAPPQNVTAVATNGRIALSWDAVAGAEGYRVHYDVKPGAPYAGIGASEGASPVEVAGATSCTLHGLTDGVTYYASVQAWRRPGRLTGAYSVEIAVTPSADGSRTGVRRVYGAGMLPGGSPSSRAARLIDLSSSDADPIRDLERQLGAWDPRRWRVFGWNARTASYEEVRPVGWFDVFPGAAYWLVSAADATLAFIRPAVDATKDASVLLAPGWNLVSNPFDVPVETSGCRIGDAAVSVFEFAGGEGYVSAPLLAPGRGYWVYHAGRLDARMTIPVPGVASIAAGRVAATAPTAVPPPPAPPAGLEGRR